MAKGKKTGGRNFEPGHSLATGRPKIPDDIKNARKLSKVEFERVLNKYIYMNVRELSACQINPETPALDLAVIQILITAIKKGDHIRFAFIIDRLVGKPKDVMELQNPDGSMTRASVIILPSNGRDVKDEQGKVLSPEDIRVSVSDREEN